MAKRDRAEYMREYRRTRRMQQMGAEVERVLHGMEAGTPDALAEGLRLMKIIARRMDRADEEIADTETRIETLTALRSFNSRPFRPVPKGSAK